jgi:hypothetical protein
MTDEKDWPHGPVSERFMRHHYGASGYVPEQEPCSDCESYQHVKKLEGDIARLTPTPKTADGSDDPVCRRCTQRKSRHLLVNYADGPSIGASALMCPTAVFETNYDGF